MADAVRGGHPAGVRIALPALEIRRAGLADLETLVETRIALFRELGPGVEGPALDAFRVACREAMSKGLREGGVLAWLATSPASPDGGARGSVVLLVYPRLPSPLELRASEGYLLNVYVAPGERRRGAGSALVGAAMAEAQRQGLARIRLHTTVDGRRVYARLGFLARDDEMELVLPHDAG